MKTEDAPRLIRRADNARRAGRPEPIWTKEETDALKAYFADRFPGAAEDEEVGVPWNSDERLLIHAGARSTNGTESNLEIAAKYALTLMPKLKARSAECQSEYVSQFKHVRTKPYDSGSYSTYHGKLEDRNRMEDAVKQVLGTGRPMLPGEAVMHARRLRDTFTCEAFAVVIDPRRNRVNVWWVPNDDTRDDQTVLAHQERIPMGFVVLLDRTKASDPELSMKSLRVDCYDNAGCKNIMDDAQRRINEIGRGLLESRHEQEPTPA